MRVVSLVPSLTETVAMTLPQSLIGATAWCTHPPGLDVPRLGGPKTPDLATIQDLRPDLVLMNTEENRRADAEALRAARIAVHVTHPRTVDAALTELDELIRRLGVDREPGWLRAARTAWSALVTPEPRWRGLVPVWRAPWIVIGPDTLASDLLSRLGMDNLCPAGPDRYPRSDLAGLRELAPDLVVLPDEPYPFTAADGPDAWPAQRYALVSGRHLTWYGPSLADAPRVLAEQLAEPAAGSTAGLRP
ncbi:MAG: cobalamin-binding protein [Dactylosporangium sp.]|nr:cobalamin-binding protein [Dactylosporangium sp.]NNJ62032.1 cobalamin-binding protein [Dactylosporangium sp.]